MLILVSESLLKDFQIAIYLGNPGLLVCVGATTGRATVLREPKDMVLVRSVALIRLKKRGQR